MKFSLQFKTLFSLRAFLSPYARAWNPYFFRFIAGKRYRYAVIDFNQFTVLFKSTFAFLRQTLLNGGRFYYFNPYNPRLFVTHSFGLELSHWIPGIFTNKLAMRRIRDLKQMPFFFPSALFLLNLEVKNVSFAREAKSLLIPTVAMMGAYFNHQLIDYPLLSNTSARLATYILDASRHLYSTLFVDWALEYSLKRRKYIRDVKFFNQSDSTSKKLNLSFIAAGDKHEVSNRLIIPRKERNSVSQEFLSFHFRNFRWFSDRYKNLWSSSLSTKRGRKFVERKNNNRFKKYNKSKLQKFSRRGNFKFSAHKITRKSSTKFSKRIGNGKRDKFARKHAR